jgi:hypothetical protein
MTTVGTELIWLTAGLVISGQSKTRVMHENSSSKSDCMTALIHRQQLFLKNGAYKYVSIKVQQV